MHRVIITPEEAKLIRDACACFVGADVVCEGSLGAIREASWSVCPDRLNAALRAMDEGRSPSGALLVQGLADPAQLGPTPIRTTVLAGCKFTLLSEIAELGIALILGEPVGYYAEKGGVLVQHVFPIRGEEEAPSNESSASMLDLHTELVFSRRQPRRPLDTDSPDFVLLSCLRSDPGRQAITLVAEVEELCARTPVSRLRVLQQPRFELRAPYSFTRDDGANRPWVGAVPVIRHSAMRLTGAFDLACGTRGTDDEAERSLAALREAAASPGAITGVRLEAGDLLVLDNRRCAHGRTPFDALYDGTDRWILRVYVRRTLEGMEPFDSRSPWVF